MCKVFFQDQKQLLKLAKHFPRPEVIHAVENDRKNFKIKLKHFPEPTNCHLKCRTRTLSLQKKEAPHPALYGPAMGQTKDFNIFYLK